MHAETFSARNLGDPEGSSIAVEGGVVKMNSQKTTPETVGKSDNLIVPEKQANKVGHPAAESVEGRRLTKRNTHTVIDGRTQSRDTITSGLMSVREAAARNKKEVFSSVLHHISPSLLERSYYSLKRESAAGVDGTSWQEYGTALQENLDELYNQVHSGTYRPTPARRIYIPKADGSKRPISIQSVRDKVIQQAVAYLLEQVYEENFLGFSYGFRLGRGQHDALDALHVGIMKKKINWILDMDIRKFFDTVDHDWLLKFLRHRITDRRVLRLITQWIKVGYVDDAGRRIKSTIGTPQGAVISPLLSNIVLHYVFDLWVKQWRSRESTGDMLVVRYADDAVLGFQNQQDAERFLEELIQRFRKFGLEIHEVKTKIVEFGRFAYERRRVRGYTRAETFDFLGFTHYCGRTRKSGAFMVWRKTKRERLNGQIKTVRTELRRRMHNHIRDQAEWLSRVITGHMNYYSVPGNGQPVSKFMYEVRKAWYKALCRRSQRKRLNWEKFDRYLAPMLPVFCVTHPYPEQRFLAKYSR